MPSLGDDLNTFHIRRSSLPPTSGDSLPTPAAESTALEAEPSADQEIDLLALAQKVYDLLKQELRVERERLGQRRIW